jgi:hypothetical protein
LQQNLVFFGFDLPVHGNNKNWIKSFLNNRTQAVALENTISDNVDVASGVP